jgi:hypothetical protein
MSQWVLKANGRVVPWHSLRPLTIAETHSPSEIKKHKVFDDLIERRWGSSISPPKVNDTEKTFKNYEDDDEPECIVPEIEDAVDAKGNLMCQQPAYD